MVANLRIRFRILNGIAIALFLSSFPIAVYEYPLIGGLFASFALLTYLVAILLTRCPNCGKLLLVNFQGPVVTPARFPAVCPRCGHDLQH